MKKLLILLALVVLGCAREDVYEPVTLEVLPIELEIDQLVGIKLESKFASSSILMNVKLDVDGNYFIKVRDIKGRVVSKEKVSGNLGDNVFKIYTKTLPKSSYKLELYRETKKVGVTSINLL